VVAAVEAVNAEKEKGASPPFLSPWAWAWPCLVVVVVVLGVVETARAGGGSCIAGNEVDNDEPSKRTPANTPCRLSSPLLPAAAPAAPAAAVGKALLTNRDNAVKDADDATTLVLAEPPSLPTRRPVAAADRISSS